MVDSKDLRQVYGQIIAAVESNDAEALDRLIAAEIVDHNPVPGQAPGIAGIKTWVLGMHEAFESLTGTVDDTVVQGEKVAARVTWRGKHVRPYAGRPGSGRDITIPAHHILYFRDGLATDWWGSADLSGLDTPW